MARSRKSKRLRHPTAATAPAPLTPSAYFSGYQGASFSTDRGQIYWPTIDTRQELDSFSRYELIRRIHFLKAHFGYLRGLIRNSAALVGWQTPQAQSGDPAWDDAAEEYFREVAGEAATFDIAGKFDFEEAQPMLMRAALTDGQILTVMTTWPDGSPRFAFYEASQLANPEGSGPDWVEGIRVSRSRRHLAYGLRDPLTDKVIVVPARNCIYFGEFDSPGQDMPVPPLAHAVNHAVDITEVWGFIKKAIKISSLSGAIIESDAAAAPPRARMGIVGAPTAAKNAAGEKFQQENVWDGGQIPALEPGRRIKILNDQRPSPEQRQLILDLKRDIAEGFGLPVEVIDEMGRLTGPGVRFVLDFAGNWINCRRARQKRWARQVWRFAIACGIANKRLALPVSSDITPKPRWWAVNFTSQRLLTVDRGKESKARLDELAAGVGTLSAWEEFDGNDWKDRGKQRIREVAFLTAECKASGLTYESVFQPRPGSAPVVPGAEIDTDPEADSADADANS